MRNINTKQIATQKTIHPQFPNKLISRGRVVAMARAATIAVATTRMGVEAAMGVGVGAATGEATGAWAWGRESKAKKLVMLG